ncbi:hypothetical protein B0H13DRAFT_2415446 [Mycena leptocephala]|nr:hypothetical protein B0H13DRAFT_2415446 [Mycena leptocephala]
MARPLGESAPVSPTRCTPGRQRDAPSSSRYRIGIGKNKKEKKKIQIQIHLAKAEPRSKAQPARPRPEHHLAPTKQTRSVQKKQATRVRVETRLLRGNAACTDPATCTKSHIRRGPNLANTTNKKKTTLLLLALPPTLHKIIRNRDRNPNGLQEPTRKKEEKKGRNDATTVCTATRAAYGPSNGNGIRSTSARTRWPPTHEQCPWRVSPGHQPLQKEPRIHAAAPTPPNKKATPKHPPHPRIHSTPPQQAHTENAYTIKKQKRLTAPTAQPPHHRPQIFLRAQRPTERTTSTGAALQARRRDVERCVWGKIPSGNMREGGIKRGGCGYEIRRTKKGRTRVNEGEYGEGWGEKSGAEVKARD